MSEKLETDSAPQNELKRICAYCRKSIKKEDFYVIYVWYDAYNRKHKKYFHTANGVNFLDSCFMRYDQAVPHDYSVELKILRIKNNCGQVVSEA